MADTLAQRAATYQPFSPVELANPYEGYAALRAEAPVFRDATTGIFVVTRYEDVRKIVTSPNIFSSRVREQLRQTQQSMRDVDAVYATHGWERIDTLSMSDPPQHTRYRNMALNGFLPAKMRASEGHVSAVVDELLDTLMPTGKMDFFTDFAVPMPIRVFAVQLGVPREEMHLFQRFGDAGIEAISMIISPQREIELAHIGVEEQKYFAAKIEQFRAAPAELLISDLANARDENGELYSIAELLSIISILVLGGNETTTNAMTTALWLMLTNPGLEARLRGDGKAIEAFCEESLRFLSPVQGVFRIAAEDTALSGVRIPKGSRVLIKFGAANRDTRQWESAAEFEPFREDAKKHIAFGAGIKHCIGAPLARLEMKVAFLKLLERGRNFRLQDAAFQPQFVPNIIVHGMASLPIAFDPC
jgi:cytochrome P450